MVESLWDAAAEQEVAEVAFAFGGTARLGASVADVEGVSTDLQLGFLAGGVEGGRPKPRS